MEGFQQRTFWLLGLGLMLGLIYLAQEAILCLFCGFIFASALSPAVEALDKKLPRWLAVLIPFIIFILIVLLVVIPVAFLASQQFQGLVSDLPGYLEHTRAFVDQWEILAQKYPLLHRISLDRVGEQLTTQGPAMFSGFTGATMAVSRVALDGLTALIMSYFLLLDREKIQAFLLRFSTAKDQGWQHDLITHLIQNTGAFVNGQILFMASFAALIFLGLNFANVPFSILFALVAGLSTLIPILGPALVMLVNAAFTWFQTGDPGLAIWVVGIYGLVQLVENNLVGPVLMGKAVGLHPLVILLSIMVGGLLFGLPGIVLAIPMASCLKILLEAQVFQRFTSTID